MLSDYITNHPSYRYALQVCNGKAGKAGKYVIKACQKFIDDLNDEESKYFLDEVELKKIEGLLKLANMSSGSRVGDSCYDALADFQWFFIVNALCWKHKDKPEKRRYEKSVLLIARKSGKSFIVAVLFYILLLIEPQFSEFYSVAPTKDLSSIVKKEIEQLLKSSPTISKYFKTLRSETQCTLTDSKFVALATSDNNMDGRKANVFVADEVGALKNRNPISAMQSSQMNMPNRTGILISTAYDTINNPMTEEVEYSKKVLDGLIEDESVFSLLYMPDNPKDWLSDETLIQANPLVIDVPENMEYLKQMRKKAQMIPSEKDNFLTKHLNVFTEGSSGEVYIANEDLKKCCVDEYDWNGKEVYVGVDLSISDDNTGVTIVHYEKDTKKYIAKSWAFFPQENIEEKTQKERVNYKTMVENGWAFGCGDRIIDYNEVENFVMNLENFLGVKVIGLGYDKFNAISSVNRWAGYGIETMEVPQTSSFLHAPTKLLKEKILKQEFAYEKNSLFEINFGNARELTDSNLNSYINKRESRKKGKIDMVASLICAMYLWHEKNEKQIESTYEHRGFLFL